MDTAKVSMAVDLGGIKMKNPVCTASGTFAFGSEFEGFYDVARLGAITTKGASAEPWAGNPAPRMCEIPSAMMNTVGLANPGIAGVAKEHGSYLASLARRGCQVIFQIAGHSVDEYVAAIDAAQELVPWAAGFEMNISCPNLARGGALVGDSPHAAHEVVSAVRAHTERPLLVKLAPMRVGEIAHACEDAGADALSLVNSFNGMSLNIHTRRSRLSRPTGGVTGPAIHAIATRMVWEAAQAVSIPINGMGGIASTEDAAEMILAGATAVSVGTANFYNPLCASEIVDGLEAWVREQKVSDIHELIGAAEC